MDNLPDLESIWENLLSRQPELVISTYNSLSSEEQNAVLAHLHRMASEAGWHSEQQKSAAAALRILKEL